MELRKAEAEVDELRAEYENLRMATVDADLQSQLQQPASFLPPLVDLLAQVQQDRNLPALSAPEGSVEPAPLASDGTTQISSGSSVGNATSGGDATDGPAAAPLSRSTAKEALEALERARSRLDALEGKCIKFRNRLGETDPVTGAPRYGSKTATRVLALLDIYDALTRGVSAAFGNDEHLAPGGATSDSAVHCLRLNVKNEEERRKRAEVDANNAAMKEAADAQVVAQQREEEERLKAMEAERERVRQEAELHQQALEARRRRAEEVARAQAAEREADRAFQDSIPKGPDGVRAQLTALRESCSGEAGAWDVAITALHTLFSQITARPEEIKFRRIRRDHPKFLQDIGRHTPGGVEVLIAAGFKLEMLDGVKSFFSKEPDLESDMDRWSDWFDRLKMTLQIIEEEMIK